MSLEPTNNVEQMMREIEDREKAERAKAGKNPDSKAAESLKKEQRRYWILILALFAFIVLVGLTADKIIMPSYVGSEDLLNVPDVLLTDTLDAIAELRNQNMTPEITERLMSQTIPAGQVINQTPQPGSKVKAGRRVYLVASRGPDRLEMPQIVGTPLREARIQLLRLGLQIGEVEFVHSERFDARVVMTQSANAGSDLERGDEIDLVVSLGPEIQLVEVPDLLGKTLPEAQRILKEAGLTLGFVNKSSEDGTFMSGTVIEQFPAGAEQVEPEAVIHLTVAR